MVVDTSAVVAVLLNEPERIPFLKKLAHAKSRHISAVSYMEAGMVLTSHFGGSAEQALEEMLREAGIVIAPVNGTQARLALTAFRQYGKGRHPAGLNFGDCFSYALAKDCGEPLLFKGFDFAKTDIPVA
jgi:ribonuclease VapC